MKKKISAVLMIIICLFTGCKNNTALANLPRDSGGSSAILSTDGYVTTSSYTPPSASIQPSGDSKPLASADVRDRADEVVEIKEKMFVAQSNDVYYNADDYLGKTIKYEGMFQSYTDSASGITYYSVVRYGPGCCGVDANCGFEVLWSGDNTTKYPEINDWVEAVGILKEYEENGYMYLRLDLTSLTVLDVRGAEYVTQ
jgi:uncharacterized membrane protein YcgQ (UPF0703/DUF1980 family)